MHAQWPTDSGVSCMGLRTERLLMAEPRVVILHDPFAMLLALVEDGLVWSGWKLCSSDLM